MNNTMKKLITLTFALFFTAGVAFAQSNSSTTTQSGSDHTATTVQTGSGISATVEQRGGNDNTAEVRQNNTPNYASMESTIEQVGSDNVARTTVSRTNSNGVMSLQEQFGDRNRALINNDEATADGNEGDDDLIQFQRGNDNLARMSGRDSYSAEQRQDGNRNVALASGLGKQADIFQRQVGNDNRAVFEGSNFGFADSRQVQIGDDNRSIMSAVGHDGPGESYLTRQVGDRNVARLQANGFGGTFEVRQNGNDNTATTTWN